MFLFLSPAPAAAQYYGYAPAPPHPANPLHRPRFSYKHRTHAYLGAQLVGMAVLGQQLDNVGTLGHGGGFGLYAGIRFNPWVGLEGNWTWTFHDESWVGPGPDNEPVEFTWANSHQIHTLTADLKIHIPTWSRVEPFLQVGGGWAFFGLSGWDEYYGPSPDGGLYTSGPTFNAGGGITYWIGPHFTLGGRLLYRGMYFMEPRYDIPGPDGNPIHTTGMTNYVNAVSADFNLAVHF
jgi:hypothetical protein